MTFIKSEVFVTKFMIYEEGMLIEIYFETKFYVEIFYQGDGYPIIHDLNLDCYFLYLRLFIFILVHVCMITNIFKHLPVLKITL